MQHWSIWDWVAVASPVPIAGIILLAYTRMVSKNVERLQHSSVRTLADVRKECETRGPDLDSHVREMIRTLCPKSRAEWESNRWDPSDPEAWTRGLSEFRSRALGIRLFDRELWKTDRGGRIAIAEALDEHMWVPVFYDPVNRAIVDSTIISEKPTKELLALSPRTTSEWLAIHMEYRFGKKWRSSAAKRHS